MPQLEQRDYERLLAFRTGLRRFLSWSGQRAVAAGLVFRQTDAEDARTVRIALTPLGLERLEGLATSHPEELNRLTSDLHTLWAGLDAGR
jgi:hypothetical protein